MLPGTGRGAPVMGSRPRGTASAVRVATNYSGIIGGVRELVKLKGSCLCGAVRFEVDSDEVGPITTCYCSRCRKSHGAERRLRARVRREGFAWSAGEDRLARYAISDRRLKLFCATCGTPILNVDRNDAQTFGLAVATLDDDPGKRNLLHLFAASRPDWLEIRDDLLVFDTVPDIRGEVLAIAIADGTLSMQPDGDGSAIELRVADLGSVRPGDRVLARLPHDADEFVITRLDPD